MNQLIIAFTKANLLQNVPEFSVGQTVRIHQKISEGEKERLQAFEGMIISAQRGKGISGSITVRKVVDGIGVERIFPIHSPTIGKIEITKQSEVSRSKLYYLRRLSGKAARMKTTLLEGKVFEPKKNVAQETVVEEPTK